MHEQAIRIHPRDNVGVAIVPLIAGQTHLGVTLRQDIPAGHKFALMDIAVNDHVAKYAFPIGRATQAIAAGDWVHSHNLKTNLSGILDYTYQPHRIASVQDAPPRATFAGYPRADGRAGIRNELWILPMVGCVNGTAQRLVRQAAEALGKRVPDGIHTFVHPYGCSQLGGDHEMTQRTLAALATHPNAGGVLVLGLGCENNTMESFRKLLDGADQTRMRFLVTQQVEDEESAAMALLGELAERIAQDQREPVGIDKLVVGLKCGGSDGFSGITANPLLGAFSDALIAAGGTSALTEVPEMFGAETLLMNRCKDEPTFQKAVALINDFKHYFERHNQAIYENPSPGNKAGGITTLEEKSLGCTQKGGAGAVTDVLGYAERIKTPGLTLLSGPGTDICAVTDLAAAGCQLILFTTGRGTPLGGPVPTVKVSTNSDLARRKPHWIDFDAGRLLSGTAMPALTQELFSLVLDIADGKRQTMNEQHDYREIAIFKDGVTM